MSVNDTRTPTVAEIHLGHLRHNIRVLKAQAAGAPLMGVVKANAYGHGAERVVKVLQDEGICDFAVATVPEAIRLRQYGLTDPLLVLAAPLPEFLPAYLDYDLGVTVPSQAVADSVRAIASPDHPLRLHVKVNTGMNRLGLWPEETADVVRMLEGTPGLILAGLWTHFATADETGDTFAAEQMARFEPVWRTLGDAFDRIHTANSGALLEQPETFAPFKRTIVRTGVALYGLYKPTGSTVINALRPVMRLTSRITHIHTVAVGESVSYGRRWLAAQPTRIATVGAGYADGYFRVLSNRALVGINGQRYSVAGTICMDMFMVDLDDPDATQTQVGDEVVLFGRGGPSAYEVAAWADTITYEVTCAVSSRVHRRYIDR